MASPNRFSFSLRFALFVMFVGGVFLAGLREPNNVLVYLAGLTFLGTLAAACYCSLRDGPTSHPWLVAFVIAAICFSLDIYLVPSAWTNRAFEWLHPVEAAREAGSVMSGLNQVHVNFDVILADGLILLLAALVATWLSLWQPTSVPWWAVLLAIIVASVGLGFVYDTVALGVSLLSGMLIALAWFVIVRQGSSANLWLMAFATSATGCLLVLQTRTLPDDGLYTILHTAPTDPMLVHLERSTYHIIERDCATLWFGFFFATCLVWLARRQGDKKEVK